jgi:opacity protein-like surface antigen
MRIPLLASAAFLAALSMAPVAAAQPNLYWGGDIGVGVGGNVDTNGTQTLIVPGESDTITAIDDETDLETGWQAGLRVGLDEAPLPNWRLEAEGLYTDNDIDGTDATSVNVWGVFANLIYDFDFGDSRWVPYAGAGVGYGQTSVEIADEDADEDGWLWQLKAGLGYELNPNATIDIGYRYLNASEANFDVSSSDDDITTDDEVILNGEIDTDIHAVTIGMRWKLGAS